MPELNKEIDRLLKENVIRKSNSPIASPAFLIRKKDGSLRLIVDFRKLNGMTAKTSYPSPRIETILPQLKNAKWFSQLDMKNGYHHVSIADEDV